MNCASDCSGPRPERPTQAASAILCSLRDVVDKAAIAERADHRSRCSTRDGEPYHGNRRQQRALRAGLERAERFWTTAAGETRLSDSTDFIEYARLCDGLEHIAYLATAFSTNKDIESQVSDAWRLYMCLTTSKKPVVSGAFSEEGVPRMAAHDADVPRRAQAELSEPNPCRSSRSPRPATSATGRTPARTCSTASRAGIPVEVVPVTLMGLIAPVTLVGAHWSSTVWTYLSGHHDGSKSCGRDAPVLFGGAPATFHMKAASSPMAAIEAQHLNVAYVQVAKSLNLPTQAYMASSATASSLDAQGGGETFCSALLAAIAGVNSVSGPGHARLSC